MVGAKGGTKLPAFVEIHGGGQSASLNTVVTYAKRGYAGISINWGGNKTNLGKKTWSGPAMALYFESLAAKPIQVAGEVDQCRKKQRGKCKSVVQGIHREHTQ